MGTAPVAVVLRELDHVLVIGSLVADELYGKRVPIAVLPEPGYSSVRTGCAVELDERGGLTVRSR